MKYVVDLTIIGKNQRELNHTADEVTPEMYDKICDIMGKNKHPNKVVKL